MNRILVGTILVVLLLTTSACTATGPTSLPIGSTVGSPSKPSGQSVVTPTLQATPTESANNILTDSCYLLNSRDLASFFTSHTEVILPAPQINQVRHPVFSPRSAAGTETSCVYYTYHLPGSNAEVVLQVTYWIDVPSPATSGDAWVQAWDQAKSEADQLISGIGDAAFVKDGRLTFRVSDVYVTVEATETDLDLKTPAGLNKQLTIEKQLALDMLSRLDY
jgi:hypothetical protein